jgi:glycosyltransferase involved in cell wall biosynthesis
MKRVLMTGDAMGGVWSYALELMRAVPDVEFAFCTMGDLPNDSQRRELAQLDNVTLHASRFALEWMDNAWSDVDRAGEWLLEIAADFAPDIVHLNGYVHAALNWNAPTLIVAHSDVLSWWRAVKHEPAPSRYDGYRERVRSGLAAADLVVAPSAWMLQALCENFDLECNGHVIPNCRSHHLFAPAAKEHVIFSAGRVWDEAKNLTALDRVAAATPWPVEIAGDQRHPNGAPTELRHARSLGTLTDGNMAMKLARSAIFALPARYEPFGLSVLEAGLCSCALVLGDIPSLRENWDGAAVFVPPDDDEQLAQALHALIGNTNERDELALRARARALEFTPERTAAAYRAAYDHLAAATSAALAR